MVIQIYRKIPIDNYECENISYLQMNSFEKLCTVLICYVLLGRIWPEGKKLFYTWLFWCSVLCSAGQRATVQRESGLDVTGPGDFPTFFLL